MGKYMRKAKITGEVAVMELAQSSLGVRTRAKTLALQRLQKTTAAAATTATTTTPTAKTLSRTVTTTTATKSESCYLQLRSRRLEKPSLLVSSNDSRKHQHQAKDGCKENPNANANPSSRSNSRVVLGSVNSGSVGSVSMSCSKKEGGLKEMENAAVVDGVEENQNDVVAVEASFGENVVEIEGRDRSTRETTPCSLIRDSETVGTPGSTTRPTNSSAAHRRIHNTVRRNIPSTHEMEEFFAGAEQQQQRIFTEKYNFDPVNELPLPGRYEWERVVP